MRTVGPSAGSCTIGRSSNARCSVRSPSPGTRSLRSADRLATRVFSGERTRALFAGIAAHSMRPLDRPLTAGVGLTLAAMCHVAGWQIPRGGAQSITTALVRHLQSLGGEVVTDSKVATLDKLPTAKAVLCDLSPRPLLEIAGHLLPRRYRRKLERYRYGVGVFKVDWALSAAIPWAAEACRTATVRGSTATDARRSARSRH